MHTLLTQDIIEISLEANENLDALSLLIKDRVAEDKPLNGCYIFSLFCELVWLNSSILRTLRRDMQEPSFKDETQKELLVSPETVKSLSTLMLAKWQATRELNSLSYSLASH